jgi:hypothetical protein
MLLILDGCDRVIDAAAALAERLSATAPGIAILATSREPLGAAEELVHQLLPLERPEHGSPVTAAEFVRFAAVQLFVERAAAGGARLSFSAEEISTIAEICARLDGVPLAIELAASGVPAFGVAGTAALPDDRLHELVNGRRTALPRHQTLGATLDWSYELLWPGQRAALRRLSVFVGSFQPFGGASGRGRRGGGGDTRPARRQVASLRRAGRARDAIPAARQRVAGALRRGLDLARALGEPLHELRLLASLHLFHVRAAERSTVLAEGLDDPAARAAAGSFLGLSQHLVGNHLAARTRLEQALAQEADSLRAKAIHFGFDYRNRSRITLPPPLARRRTRCGDGACRTDDGRRGRAAAPGDPVHRPHLGMTVFLWVGDAENSEDKIDRLLANAKKHSLNPYNCRRTWLQRRACRAARRWRNRGSRCSSPPSIPCTRPAMSSSPPPS